MMRGQFHSQPKRIVDLIANTHLAHCDHLKREEAVVATLEAQK